MTPPAPPPQTRKPAIALLTISRRSTAGVSFVIEIDIRAFLLLGFVAYMSYCLIWDECPLLLAPAAGWWIPLLLLLFALF